MPGVRPQRPAAAAGARAISPGTPPLIARPSTRVRICGSKWVPRCAKRFRTHKLATLGEARGRPQGRQGGPIAGGA